MVTSIEKKDCNGEAQLGICLVFIRYKKACGYPRKIVHRFDLCALSVDPNLHCHEDPWFAPDYASHVE
jgi:hypothetical protein